MAFLPMAPVDPWTYVDNHYDDVPPPLIFPNITNVYNYYGPPFDYSNMSYPYYYSIPNREYNALDTYLRSTIHIINFVFSVVGLFFVSAFGIASNITCIVVFYRQGLVADSCTPCFLGMAVVDLCFSIFSLLVVAINIPVEIARATTVHLVGIVHYFEALAKMFKYYRPVFSQISFWITTYLAFERMVSVVFPFTARNIFKPRNSYIIICFIYAFCLALNIPRIVVWEIQYMFPQAYNTVFNSKISLDSYLTLGLVGDVCGRLLCIILIVIFNTIIATKVRGSMKFRNTSSSSVSSNKETMTPQNNKIDLSSKTDTSVQRQIRLVRMMAALSIIAVACNIPYCFKETLNKVMSTSVYKYNLKIMETWTSVSYYLESVSAFFENVNSSCNIFVYLGMSTKFRRALKPLFSCRK